ncbi:MAG: hypothetical protein EON55_24175, partial [Alphaproteobacteria bacterium]
KYTIIIGSVIIIVGVFLQTFANGLVMFAVARAIIGLGLSFECTAAPMLVTELAHPTHRAQLSTFLNTLYNFGATIAAWICLGTLTIQSDWANRPLLGQTYIAQMRMKARRSADGDFSWPPYSSPPRFSPYNHPRLRLRRIRTPRSFRRGPRPMGLRPTSPRSTPRSSMGRRTPRGPHKPEPPFWQRTIDARLSFKASGR